MLTIIKKVNCGVLDIITSSLILAVGVKSKGGETCEQKKPQQLLELR